MKATCGLLVLVAGLVLATPAGAAGVKPEESEEEVVKKAAEAAAADPQQQPSLDEATAAEEARVSREERGQAAEQARIEREGPDRTYRPLPTNRMFRASEKRVREQARAGARAKAEGAASSGRGDEAPGPVEGDAAATPAAVATASPGRSQSSGWLVFAGVALATGLAAAVALSELG